MRVKINRDKNTLPLTKRGTLRRRFDHDLSLIDALFIPKKYKKALGFYMRNIIDASDFIQIIRTKLFPVVL